MPAGWPYRRGRTATVTRSTIDPVTRDPTGAAPHDLTSCAWDPGSTTGVDGRGQTTTTTPRLFAAYDADVTTGDQVTITGVEGSWWVVGEVLRWRNDLTGSTPCSEVHLSRTKGEL